MYPIPKMVMPSQKRNGIMRGGILQIMITRACDLACHGCTQGSQLAGKPVMMTPDQFDAACASLEGYFGVVGVFGGNPAMHPQFSEICSIMRGRIPYMQRGLWCNNLRGKGADARITFNPRHSNFNVHMSKDAYDEFARDWPESIPYLKGLDVDSVHVTPWVAAKDVIPDELDRWDLISKCDINRNWSAMIGVFRGELRAWFCEVAGAMSMLHQDNPDWNGTGQPIPDTGVPVVKDWWRQPQTAFESQIREHCPHCGVPVRRPGQLAVGGDHEEFSETHRWIARPKVRERPVQLVEIQGIPPRVDRPSTEYLRGVTPGYARA